MSPLAQQVATEIRVWMARRSMTQVDLAAAVGHDQTWVSKRLSGRTAITVDDLEAITRALDVDPSALVGQNLKCLTSHATWDLRPDSLVLAA